MTPQDIPPVALPVQRLRPKIKDYFGEDATLEQVHNTYLSQPELFKYAQALDNYIDEIESQPDAVEQEEMWISVKDETPEVGFYLVAVEEIVASKKRGLIEIGECYKSVSSDLKEITRFHDYVTHWMPLPKKPITP